MAAHLTGAALALRIQQLSQGTSSIMTPGSPSRHTTKVRSGRQGRKQYNSRQALQKVGGFSSMRRAIEAPADYEMCVVVNDRTGYKNGVVFRSPSQNL